MRQREDSKSQSLIERLIGHSNQRFEKLDRQFSQAQFNGRVESQTAIGDHILVFAIDLSSSCI